MSMLDICTTEKQLNYYKNYQDNHQRITSLYNRYAGTDTLSTNTSLSRSSSFEVIFSKLLDALIFTSAIAITAYSYLTGTLSEPTPPSYTKQLDYSSPIEPNLLLQKRYEDDKRQRTQAWAEQQLIKTKKRKSCFIPKVQPLETMKREKKRTQSLPVNKITEDDDLFNRMEERLQSLIQQGQEALSSPIL